MIGLTITVSAQCPSYQDKTLLISNISDWSGNDSYRYNEFIRRKFLCQSDQGIASYFSEKELIDLGVYAGVLDSENYTAANWSSDFYKVEERVGIIYTRIIEQQ